MPASVSPMLRKAQTFAKKGEIDQALQHYQDILASYPQNKQAIAGIQALQQSQAKRHTRKKEISQQLLRELMMLLHQQRYQEALENSARLQKIYPASLAIPNFQGGVYASLGRFDQAVNCYRKALAIDPGSAEIHFNLANAYSSLGEFDKAIGSFQQALTLKPDYFEASYQMALVYQQQGRIGEAVTSYRNAVAINPDFADAYNNLGIALLMSGEHEESLASFRNAIARNPDSAETYCNQGVALQQLEKNDEAIASYHEAIAINPDYAEAFNNLGNAHRAQENFQDSIASYQQALRIDPNYIRCFINLCEVYEKTNDLESLGELLSEDSFQTFHDEDNVKYYLALAAFRAKDIDRSLEIVTGVKPNKIAKERLALFFNLKGRILDSVGRADDAFESFVRMNHEELQSAPYQAVDSDGYFRRYETQLQELKNTESGYSANETSQEASSGICFMVGFPRSGTTLLDTILRTHSEIAVVEEKDMIYQVSDALQEERSIDYLESLDAGEVENLRSVYSNTLKAYHASGENQITIDKYPLSALEVPLINKLFPQVKFILAIRHPMDCVLSCFMQSFRANEAMVNMTRLDRIVELYCLTMETFFSSHRRYGTSYQIIRYEDLVADLETEVTSILSFLNLEWEESLLRYQETARNRKVIDTPSYSQVVQPIYKEATYRWHKYEKYLAKYYPQLEPWIEKLGYGTPA